MSDLQDMGSDDASRVPARGDAPAAAGASDLPPLPRHKSLRARGLVTTLALLAYVALAGLYVADVRGDIDASVNALTRLSRHEKALVQAEAAVGSALREVGNAGGDARPLRPAQIELLAGLGRDGAPFAALEEFDPGYTRLHRAIARDSQALAGEPSSGHHRALHDSLARAAAELEIRRTLLGEQRESLIAGYQRSYDAVTVQTMLLSMIGLGVFGSLAVWFFNGLARDICRLEAHARQVVRGARGHALPVRRNDELGRLMHAVNRMAHDLDTRERHIELEGQRRSHHDKMLAVAALAAGVAHEVNNPLMVIAGSAQALRASAHERHDEQGATEAERILLQTQRAAQAARTLADAAAPQPTARDWFDLEALVRRVLQWMAYDRRYRGFAVEVEAARGLPAVFSSADVVQQVLMQMLSLACDTVALRGDLHATLRLALAQEHEMHTIQVQLSFTAPLDFSRAAVQRAVMLARATLAPLTAQLAFGQAVSGGGHIKLILPVHCGDELPNE